MRASSPLRDFAISSEGEIAWVDTHNPGITPQRRRIAMERYIGMDVYAARRSFSVLDASGKELRRDVVETNSQALVGSAGIVQARHLPRSKSSPREEEPPRRADLPGALLSMGGFRNSPERCPPPPPLHRRLQRRPKHLAGLAHGVAVALGGRDLAVTEELPTRQDRGRVAGGARPDSLRGSASGGGSPGRLPGLVQHLRPGGWGGVRRARVAGGEGLEVGGEPGVVLLQGS